MSCARNVPTDNSFSCMWRATTAVFHVLTSSHSSSHLVPVSAVCCPVQSRAFSDVVTARTLQAMASCVHCRTASLLGFTHFYITSTVSKSTTCPVLPGLDISGDTCCSSSPSCKTMSLPSCFLFVYQWNSCWFSEDSAVSVWHCTIHLLASGSFKCTYLQCNTDIVCGN